MIDREVKRIIDECYEKRPEHIILDSTGMCWKAATALLIEKEKIGQEEFEGAVRRGRMGKRKSAEFMRSAGKFHRNFIYEIPFRRSA